jgi:hypothetical protein
MGRVNGKLSKRIGQEDDACGARGFSKHDADAVGRFLGAALLYRQQKYPRKQSLTGAVFQRRKKGWAVVLAARRKTPKLVGSAVLPAFGGFSSSRARKEAAVSLLLANFSVIASLVLLGKKVSIGFPRPAPLCAFDRRTAGTRRFQQKTENTTVWINRPMALSEQCRCCALFLFPLLCFRSRLFTAMTDKNDETRREHTVVAHFNRPSQQHQRTSMYKRRVPSTELECEADRRPIA